MALGEDPPVVGPACFHSQQAAEKAMKGALVLEGIEFPYVHDLRRLRNLLPDGWPGGPSNIALQRLTEMGGRVPVSGGLAGAQHRRPVVGVLGAKTATATESEPSPLTALEAQAAYTLRLIDG